MSHLYQTTKIAEFHQAQLRKDADQRRISRSSSQSQETRYPLRMRLAIALSTLVFLAILISPGQAKPEQSVLSGWVKVTDHTNPGVCIHPDHLQICRGRSSVILIETNDSRFAGEATFVFDSISTRAPYMEQVRGKFHMGNHDGSWSGVWKGATNSQGYTQYTAEGQGRGSFEGLAIRLQMERSNSNRWEPMSVSGTIGKGRVPARRR